MSFPVINSKLWTRTDQYKIRITITKLLAGYPAANRPDPDIRSGTPLLKCIQIEVGDQCLTTKRMLLYFYYYKCTGKFD